MATLRVKARTKPTDERLNRSPATATQSTPLQGKEPVSKAADASPASFSSLRAYLKANH